MRDMTKTIKIIIIIKFMTFFINDKHAKFINFLHLMIFRLFDFKLYIIIIC